MLTITDLTVATDFPLLEHANLNLEKGKIIGLSAPNGTGKSTLLRTIAGLRNEKNGSAQMSEDGRPLPFYEAKRKLFYFETSAWFDPNLTGRNYLTLIRSQWNSNAALEESIAYWSMENYIDRPIKKYSLGMKQKLLLALYSVADAEYWLLDEPTLALDRASVEQLKDFFLTAKQQQKSIFFSAHENEQFFSICDQMYRIELYQLIESESW